jgi:hypothetical protein
MADEKDKTFRQEPKKAKIDPSEIMGEAPTSAAAPAPEVVDKVQLAAEKPTASLNDVLATQRQAGVAVPDDPVATKAEPRPQDGISVTGNMPPGMQQMLQQRLAEVNTAQAEESGRQTQPNPNAPFQTPQQLPPHQQENARQLQPGELMTNDPHLNALLNALNTQNYERVPLPSKGRFYHDEDQPMGGEVHIRPMTGQEETILSTARLMRQGRGIEMIFRNCLMEKHINPEKLLSVDRTYLLIYLRGISYGHIYEVTVKCPECGHSFDHDINLNLPVDYCPDNFHEDSLAKTLPKTRFTFRYHMMTGAHETEISAYRDRKTKFSNATDDSFLYKASLLIDEIGNDNAKVNNRHAIQSLMERLPVADINYIRNTLNNPPFGVDTELIVPCPACGHEFPVELPYEANFFFPKERIEIEPL